MSLHTSILMASVMPGTTARDRLSIPSGCPLSLARLRSALPSPSARTVARRESRAAVKKQSGAEERPDVDPPDADELAGRGDDVCAERCRAEGDRTGHVEPGPVPGAGVVVPQLVGGARPRRARAPREEEADRTPRVGHPSRSKHRPSRCGAPAARRTCSTLKRSVPTNWMAAAHQSANSPMPRRARGGRRPLGASWMNPARVKKSEPGKNVAASQTGRPPRRTDGNRSHREEHGADHESPGFPPKPDGTWIWRCGASADRIGVHDRSPRLRGRRGRYERQWWKLPASSSVIGVDDRVLVEVLDGAPVVVEQERPGPG